MSSPRRQARTALSLLNATGSASASVIASRMLAFSHPGPLTPWQQSEAQRMASEKIAAAGDGWMSAWTELALMPGRMWQLGHRSHAWTPMGALQAWTDVCGLWLGVGNAALRPAMQTAVRNRTRLARGGR